MQLLRATTERANRSAARVVAPVSLVERSTETGIDGIGGTAATCAMAPTTTAWFPMPAVDIDNFGKYHARRLQEVPT